MTKNVMKSLIAKWLALFVAICFIMFLSQKCSAQLNGTFKTVSCDSLKPRLATGMVLKNIDKVYVTSVSYDSLLRNWVKKNAVVPGVYIPFSDTLLSGKMLSKYFINNALLAKVNYSDTLASGKMASKYQASEIARDSILTAKNTTYSSLRSSSYTLTANSYLGDTITALTVPSSGTYLITFNSGSIDAVSVTNGSSLYITIGVYVTGGTAPDGAFALFRTPSYAGYSTPANCSEGSIGQTCTVTLNANDRVYVYGLLRSLPTLGSIRVIGTYLSVTKLY